MGRKSTDYDRAYDKIRKATRRRSAKDIIEVYRTQLQTLRKIGVGNKTQHNTVVTQNLIDITQKRLDQLKLKVSLKKYKAVAWWEQRLLDKYKKI